MRVRRVKRTASQRACRPRAMGPRKPPEKFAEVRSQNAEVTTDERRLISDFCILTSEFRLHSYF